MTRNPERGDGASGDPVPTPSNQSVSEPPADGGTSQPPVGRSTAHQRRRRIKISLATIGTVVTIATGLLTLRDQIFGAGSAPDRGVQRAALAPAGVPPVVDECSVRVEIGADGNAGPLLCGGGKLNVLAWEYFAKNSPLVMAVGSNATPDQVLRAMCSDLHANSTIPFELSAYQLAATYYGWKFGVDPRQEFVDGNC